MPLDEKSARMERNFQDRYGKEGRSIFYATLNDRINKGKPIKVGESKHLIGKRKNKRGLKRAARRSKRRG